jgi:hypothetical protein
MLQYNNLPTAKKENFRCAKRHGPGKFGIFSLKKTFQSLVARRNKRVLHFLHIGKTGGTAIKEALTPHAESGDWLIKLHRHAVTLENIAAGEGVIFFLRDPLTRFVSGFYSRQRQGQPRYFYRWSPDEKSAFERFATPNKLALALSDENAETRAAAEKAMRTIQHVRDFYARWFGSEDYFRSRLPDIFFIGFQETLGKDFETLKSLLRLPKNISLPGDEVASHKSPAHLDKRLDPKAVENLTKWYGDDSRFYNLCKVLVAENKIAGPQANSGFGRNGACCHRLQRPHDAAVDCSL